MKKSNQTSHSRPISTREKSRYALKLLCVCALMTALSVVLDGFLSLPVGSGIKFTFGFLPPAIVGMLYGPIPSAIVFGLADLIAVFAGLSFGPFHPGFTFCNVLMGFCFGLCLHPHPFGQKRERPVSHPKLRTVLGVLTPALFNNLICGLILNTCWVSMIYGSKTYLGWFLYRLPQYAVMIPVYIILLFVLSRLAPTLRKMGFGKA
ncbi:MAG: folate family ECF transporter S component [Clostridia bacterium]|nr:folate family ECF transporter S component [Clostridia bacterium]